MAELRVALTSSDRGVRTEFSVPPGQTLGLVGPNGSGKSTLLDAIAGWFTPERGRAQLGHAVLFDTATGENMAPHLRRIGYLSQEPLLFPHWSVEKNVRAGMSRAGVPQHERAAQAALWLERVGMAGLGKRRPHELSGGQQQRAALARVLASGPELVLLDEPFAAVDQKSLPGLREVLGEVLVSRTAILVSHSPEDVAELTAVVHHVG